MAAWLVIVMLGQAVVGVPGPSDVGPGDALLARSRALTSIRAHCTAPTDPEEVMVCARRRADTYRLPLVDRTAGSRADPTPDQRLAGIAPRSNCDNLTPFLVGCGSLGVGIGLASDGSSRTFTARERTPDIAR